MAELENIMCDRSFMQPQQAYLLDFHSLLPHGGTDFAVCSSNNGTMPPCSGSSSRASMRWMWSWRRGLIRERHGLDAWESAIREMGSNWHTICWSISSGMWTGKKEAMTPCLQDLPSLSGVEVQGWGAGPGREAARVVLRGL